MPGDAGKRRRRAETTHRRPAAGSLRALVIVLTVLAACTGGGGQAAGPEATATAPAPDGTEGPTGGASTPPGTFPEDADVLDVAIAEPSTLDPMRIQDPGSVLVARQLYEGLTAWDAQEQQVVPAAAERWEITNGGRTFTFQLRPGMTFHDGSPVTADDFVFAFNRIALKKNGSELAYALERVEGFNEVNQLGSAKRLSGIRAPDEQTLVITLSEPFMDLPAVLTHPGLVPLQEEAVAVIDRFLSQPIGNGAFQLAAPWRPGDPVILERFAGFIETPSLDGIRFTPFPDAAASWLQFVGEEYDVAEVPAGQTEAAQEEYGDAGFKPFLAGYYFGFNLRSKNLDDKRLREAISKGIDRPAIADRIYKGTLAQPRGIVPAGMPGFENQVCGDLCSHSPEEAEELVQSLPRKERSIRLEYTAGRPHAAVARSIKRDLKEIGLDVKVKAYGFSKYLERLRDGDQQMYRLGWIAEFPSPDVFLSSLFGSESPDNHTNFRSGRVDDLLARAHGEPSEERRLALYRRAERAILQDVPIAPIGSFMTHWAAQDNVEDIYFDVMGGFDAVEVSLADE